MTKWWRLWWEGLCCEKQLCFLSSKGLCFCSKKGGGGVRVCVCGAELMGWGKNCSVGSQDWSCSVCRNNSSLYLNLSNCHPGSLSLWSVFSSRKPKQHGVKGRLCPPGTHPKLPGPPVPNLSVQCGTSQDKQAPWRVINKKGFSIHFKGWMCSTFYFN